MNRNTAIQILNEMVSNTNLRQHSLTIGLVCEAFAKATGNDAEKFFVAGILHDADWEKHPEEHPAVIVQKLVEAGETEIAHAISCHGKEFGVPQTSLLDRVLIAADELTGFVMACAKVKPDGLNSLKPESVLKKFKDKKFAGGVSRDEVNYGLTVLGADFIDFTEFIIRAVAPHSEKVGLPGYKGSKEAILAPTYSHNGKHFEAIEYRRPDLDEQQKTRYAKREKLIQQGINVYPGALCDINTYAEDIHADKIVLNTKGLKVAGRIMSVRDSGKTIFLNLQDKTGVIQLWVNEDIICSGDDKSLFREFCQKMLDRGDIIGVTGEYFLTRTGEKTIKVFEIKMLTKALRPLPAVKQSTDDDGNMKKHYDIIDAEFVYRQRYADLVIHPEKRNVFVKRTKIIDTLRTYFNQSGALEVDTPVLQLVYGGATARPFKTHHNTLDTELYLRIANELYLKRLIVGGFDAVYEFSKDFRNEGMSRWHNPEFTQVEAYFAYKDYLWMMSFVEKMIEAVVVNLHGRTTVNSFGHLVDFKTPWKRTSMRDAILSACTIDIFSHTEDSLRSAIKELHLNIEADTIVGKGKLIDELFGLLVEPNLIQPTFIVGYPVELSPLAKKSDTDETMTDRFEGFCVGKEFCNAFSEINDPVDQRERFEEQLKLGKRGDIEAMAMDEDFLRSLEYGMPPTAGLGLGIDRLCMILLDQRSIQDVLLFPQMRPEKFDK